MKKNITLFKILLGLFFLILVYFIFNQFDADLPENVFTLKDLRPASYEKDNGFYLVAALPEPQDADVLKDPVYTLYRRRFDKSLGAVQPWKEWNFVRYRGLFSPYLGQTRMLRRNPAEWTEFALSKQKELRRLETDFSGYLRRYRKLLSFPKVDDFSEPRFYYDDTCLLTMARLHTALTIASIFENKDKQSRERAFTIVVPRLITQVDLARNIIRSSRTYYLNRAGRSLLIITLSALNDLMNHPDCPARVSSLIYSQLPPFQIESYGGRDALIGFYLAVDDFLDKLGDQVERGYVIVGKRLGTVAYAFLQKNRTRVYMFEYISLLLEFEKIPPYRWKTPLPNPEELDSGWVWWLQNPTGKYLFKNILDESDHRLKDLIFGSYRLKARYDMFRIAAELKHQFSANTETAPSPVDLLSQLESYKTPDPFSGKPYKFRIMEAAPGRTVCKIYSVGMNRKDDGGQTGHLAGQRLDIVFNFTLVKSPQSQSL